MIVINKEVIIKHDLLKNIKRTKQCIPKSKPKEANKTCKRTSLNPIT